MIWLTVAWVILYAAALGDSLRWLQGSIRRRAWRAERGLNGAMQLEIEGQVGRGWYAIAQTTLNLVVGILSLAAQFGLILPGKGIVQIVLLMGGAVVTMLLRRLEVRHRARVEEFELKTNGERQPDADARL